MLSAIFLRRKTFKCRRLVRSSGFEPPRYCYRQPLKLMRLPVPPRPHTRNTLILAKSADYL